MSKPDNATLKEARDSIVSDVADQARAFGGLPDLKRIEAFVDPIMRKVEVDADAEKPSTAKVDPQRARELGPGDWYGEPDHSPQIGVEGKSLAVDHPDAPMGVAVTPEDAAFTRTPDGALKADNAAARAMVAAQKARERQARMMRLMLSLPAWRGDVDAAASLCGKHLRPDLENCFSCRLREQRLTDLFERFAKQYGALRRQALAEVLTRAQETKGREPKTIKE